MNNQRLSRFAPTRLLLIARHIIQLIFSLDLFNRSSKKQQQPDGYLLKPQYILPQDNVTLLYIRK